MCSDQRASTQVIIIDTRRVSILRTHGVVNPRTYVLFQCTFLFVRGGGVGLKSKIRPFYHNIFFLIVATNCYVIIHTIVICGLTGVCSS